LTVKYEGVVRWFNDEKGYGFIRIDGSERDTFVHARQLRESAIEGDITQGNRFEFEVSSGKKGEYAINLRRI
jgi:CspA family cold shock protein